MDPVRADLRGLSLKERLALRHLPDTGLLFEEQLAPDWLNQLLFAEWKEVLSFTCTDVQPTNVTVQPLGAIVERPPISIRGTLVLTLKTTCVRCLDILLHPQSTRLDETLLAPGTVATDEPTYEDDLLDLPAILREGLLLDLPLDPICSESAACDARTQRLLEQANATADTPGAQKGLDPRWAALAELRKKADDN